MARQTRTLIFTILMALTCALSIGYTSNMTRVLPVVRNRSWEQIRDAKVRADMSKIPSDWILDSEVIETAQSRRTLVGNFFESLLDDDTTKITAMDYPALREQMQKGLLTAVKIVTAFCKRAAYAHQVARLLLEIDFDSAIGKAQELDDYFKEHRKLVGPLHGAPFTMKDQFHIKGLETSMAFVGWIGTFEGKKGTGKERNTESELVREFHSLGAIPIGKTTLVQSIWAPETNNNILGYAKNPYNQKLSTGGSSGGEAALQALKGSLFGIATDIGGSVSMPASFQGLYSLKPSVGRIAFKDVGQGQQVMPTVAGIMSHSVEMLELIFKSLLDTEPWLHDPYVLPIPWRGDQMYHKSREEVLPSFGYMANDGLVTPHPPIARAMETIRKALTNAGYELLDWHPPSNNESIEIHGPIARGDGCPDVYEAIKLSGEPIVPEISHLFPGGKLRPPLLLPEYEDVVIHMKDFRRRWQDYWNTSNQKTKSGRPVEAIISPVSPYAAVLPGKFFHSPYSSVINVLDYCTIVIPVTLADKNIDKVSADFHPLTERDQINMDSYDPDAYHGAPAGIQLIGRRLNEERLLSMAALVSDVLSKYKSQD